MPNDIAERFLRKWSGRFNAYPNEREFWLAAAENFRALGEHEPEPVQERLVDAYEELERRWLAQRDQGGVG